MLFSLDRAAMVCMGVPVYKFEGFIKDIPLGAVTFSGGSSSSVGWPEYVADTKIELREADYQIYESGKLAGYAQPIRVEDVRIGCVIPLPEVKK